MKRFIITFAIITLIFEILMFPKDAMSYAATGLTLWFDNMIPALFPFMVISGLAIRLDIAPNIISILHPVLKRIFHTDSYCEYAIVMGFLCGYPMGAIIIKDLLESGKITVSKADYLLAFCNNIGPVFFCSIVLPFFPKEYYPMLIGGMYGIPFVYGIILRYTFYKNVFSIDKKINISTEFTPEKDVITAFTEAMNQAVSSSLYLGACMIFFNMLRFLPALFFKENLLLEGISAWLLEVNGAVAFTGQLYAEGKETLALLLLPFITIGGLSCLCQTIGILQNTKCNLLNHFLHKIIQCVLWILLTCVLLFLS